jgi:hypothetical protein
VVARGGAEGSPRKKGRVRHFAPGLSVIAPVPAFAVVATRRIARRISCNPCQASIRPTGWGLHHSHAFAWGRTADYPGRTSRLGEQLHSMLLPPPPGRTRTPLGSARQCEKGPPLRGKRATTVRRPRCGVFLVEMPARSGLNRRAQDAEVLLSRPIPRAIRSALHVGSEVPRIFPGRQCRPLCAGKFANGSSYLRCFFEAVLSAPKPTPRSCESLSCRATC